jgi:hypothetical protein
MTVHAQPRTHVHKVHSPSDLVPGVEHPLQVQVRGHLVHHLDAFCKKKRDDM